VLHPLVAAFREVGDAQDRQLAKLRRELLPREDGAPGRNVLSACAIILKRFSIVGSCANVCFTSGDEAFSGIT